MKKARTPVIVKGPYPTVEDVAKTMGVSPARMREVIRIVDDIHDRHEKKRKTQTAAAGRHKPQPA